MKKNKSSSLSAKIQRIIKGKGFYIALSSLIVLVGFSIYARRVQVKNQPESMSFDDEAWQAALEESGVEFQSSLPTEDTVSETAKDTDKIDPDTSVSDTEPQTTATEELPTAVETSASAYPTGDPEKMLMPCSGVILEPCSLDNLVYCSATDDWRTHNGLDIAAIEGNPVLAAASGTVSRVYNDDMLGVVLVLDHGNGVSSLYGNLQSTDFISVGTQVQAGDIIGGVGKPGLLEADKEPHLHFEVYKNNELQNPESFLGI